MRTSVVKGDNLLRITTFVSGLGLPIHDSLMFSAGMVIEHVFAQIEAITDSPVIGKTALAEEAAPEQDHAIHALTGQDKSADPVGEDPQVAHALGYSDDATDWLAGKLGVSPQSETTTVEPLGDVRKPFVVFNGWKITVKQQREGKKTKYSLYAVKDGQEQREVTNSRPHALNWIKKHCT